MSKKIIYVDASGIKNLGCGRLFYLKCLAHYGPKGKQNVSTHFGTCLHTYAEHYFLDGEIEALRPAMEEWKSVDLRYKKGPRGNEYLDPAFLTRSMMVVKDFLNADQHTEIVQHKGKPWTEFKFAIPFYQDEEVEVIVCGTIDKVCKIRRGSYALGDYKFTAKWGDPQKFLESYKLDPQPRMYRWAIRWMAEKFPDSIYGELAEMNLGFFIDAGFHSKSTGLQMVRSDVFYESERDQDEFDSMLRANVKQIAALWKYHDNHELPQREGIFKGQCKTIYGECDFARVCATGNSGAEQGLLKNFYEHKLWNPLTEW